MPLTLGSNINSLKALRTLGETQSALSSVFERLSSGQRINRASDDAASLSVSSSLEGIRRVYNQGIRNVNDGLSLLNIADSAVAELTEVVTRIEELAVQSANGSLSVSQRTSLNDEAQALREEFFRISRTAKFNGVHLFDGSVENGLRIQGGYGESGSIASSLGGKMGTAEFSLSSTDPSIAMRIGELVDINLDGNLDLVSAATFSGSVQIFFGDGAGSFGSSSSYAAGGINSEISVSDLNNDGILDILAHSSTDNVTSVLLGTANGGFEAAIDPGLDPSIDLIHVADFNRDGIQDLVGLVGGDVQAYFGVGDGTFISGSTFSVGNNGNIAGLADFNGDGALDILMESEAEGEILFGNGDGTFQAAQTLSSLPTFTSLHAADVNGDSIEDIVSWDGSELISYLGLGDGTFTVGGTSGGESISAIEEFADLNSDGFLDIIQVSGFSQRGRVLLGNGDGTFSLGERLDGVQSIGAGDMNNDGIPDLVTSKSDIPRNISIYLNDTRDGIAPLLEFSLLTQADALQALAPISRKLDSLTLQRGVIGAFQSRLSSAVSTLAATSENYAAANSRLLDADMAFEAAELARLQILQQSSVAVLAQANLQPQLSLSLLRPS